MPSKIEDESLDDSPPLVDPYEVLGINSNATADEIKFAYRKQALKHHPGRHVFCTIHCFLAGAKLTATDKVSSQNKSAANVKFQEITFSYAVLSDTRRRARYDATGNLSESAEEEDGFNWKDFFRAQKAELIDGSAIQKIKEEYQHSEQERADLFVAFQKYEGDMDAIYAELMCSNVLEDDERFRSMIDEAIENKKVTPWKNYQKETAATREKRRKAARKEANEAEEYAQQLGVAGQIFGNNQAKNGAAEKETGLKALIQKRQKGRQESFLDGLEAKYASGKARSRRGSKRPPSDEPPEEAFERNRKKQVKT